MDVRSLYEGLHRDPEGFPLFERVWQVLNFAPSSKHSQEEELVSYAADAFDYLQADGKWKVTTSHGSTEMFFNGHTLKVAESDSHEQDFKYEHTFTVH